MKKVFAFILIVVPILLLANSVSQTQARQKAEELILMKSVNHCIDSISKLENSQNNAIAFLVELSPQGYILISTNDTINPIIGYSFQNNFTANTDELEIMQSWLAIIHNSNLNYLSRSQKHKNAVSWNTLLSPSDEFQQWPEPGATATGGWLETNWSQSSPYNQFCPIDPGTGLRSVAGCPSIVMAQIINFHRQINQTLFNDDDDFHMYNSSANNYIIDDDAHLYGFLSYQELNDLLVAIDNVYNGNEDLTNEEIAALIFASGAAIKQSYSSSVSGNYYDQQIINGFRRFGYETTELLWEEEPQVFKRLSENMKVALPARLGILSDSAGHQIVVDGYNTDEEFHFNFGWGGGSNGWFSFPLYGMPYQMNMFGSVDLDINQTWEECPNFIISSPLAGTMFQTESNIPIQIEETGIFTIDSLEIYVNNDLFQTGHYPLNCSLDLSLLGNGNHKITIIAYTEEKKMRVKTSDFEINCGNIIFEENFDEDWENEWEITSGNTNFTWQILENSLESFSETNSNNISSATCPVAYGNMNEVIISQPIPLPVVDELEWIFYVGFCDRYPNYPAITTSISTDDGQTWIDVWQTFTTISEWTWKQISIDLSDYTGEVIKMKFTCSGFSYADVSIDCIRIIEPQEVPIENNLMIPELALSNFPNPFNPETNIQYNIPHRSKVLLQIYNIKGQLVKTLVNSQQDSGIYNIVWNGRSKWKNKVSSGVYFLKLSTPKYVKIKKIELLK